jgi:hypothetical protein
MAVARAALVVAVCGWLASVGDGAEQRPNIVLIVADDLGFNEMGFNNASRGLQTPNLDGLAAKGAILRHYYTNPLCSPTRSVCCWCASPRCACRSLPLTDRARRLTHRQIGADDGDVQPSPRPAGQRYLLGHPVGCAEGTVPARGAQAAWIP